MNIDQWSADREAVAVAAYTGISAEPGTWQSDYAIGQWSDADWQTRERWRSIAENCMNVLQSLGWARYGGGTASGDGPSGGNAPVGRATPADGQSFRNRVAADGPHLKEPE